MIGCDDCDEWYHWLVPNLTFEVPGDLFERRGGLFKHVIKAYFLVRVARSPYAVLIALQYRSKVWTHFFSFFKTAVEIGPVG